MTSSARLQCQECGCICENCRTHNSLHLHKEIEELKSQVLQREYHILQMESSMAAMAMAAADKYPNGEYAALSDEMLLCQDKYERLLESHRKLQRVNQGLEDKLLKIVDKYETEKAVLNRDLASLTARLVDARVSVMQLEEENEHYRNDCNIAIQLLQCKPSNFVAHRLDSFPAELQQKAKVHLSTRKMVDSTRDQQNGSGGGGYLPEARTIRVPIPTFPPTAMVYSVNDGGGGGGESQMTTTTTTSQSPSTMANDIVSAAIMAKVLEERAKERDSVCFSNGRPSGRYSCKSRNGVSSCPPREDAGTQTQWTISPTVGSFGGNGCRTTPPQDTTSNTKSNVAGNAAASVHSPSSAWPAPDADVPIGRRWQMRSGSSTSTETEI